LPDEAPGTGVKCETAVATGVDEPPPLINRPAMIGIAVISTAIPASAARARLDLLGLGELGGSTRQIVAYAGPRRGRWLRRRFSGGSRATV
jgi:hypothetical protein